MEQILAKLLVPESSTIHEGTRELKEAFKNPEAIPALCDIIVRCTNPEVRQIACIVLRRRFTKRRQWHKLSVDLKNRIKQGILPALVNEQEKFVKNSIAQFVGILGKHENEKWPELLQFIYTLCNSESLVDREMGLYTLSIISEMDHSFFLNQHHIESFATLFSNVIRALTEPDSNLAYFTIITMKNLVPNITGNQKMITVFQQMLPTILIIINGFALSGDDKRACEVFELLEILIEFIVVVVAPHVKGIVEFCITIGINKTLSTTIRIKAIGVIAWFIRLKPKVIQKNHLVERIIDVLIELMAEATDEEISEDYFADDPDELTTITMATQSLDLIALNIPSEIVVPYIVEKIEPVLKLNHDITTIRNSFAKKAAYVALAVLADGCGTQIRTKYLNDIMSCIFNAIQDPSTVVRNAALFALGQFAEFLQPEINDYATALLPLLITSFVSLLDHMKGNNNKSLHSLRRFFYALNMFCENLEYALIPFLPQLMTLLFDALSNKYQSTELKTEALRLLRSVITATKEHILPYFPVILEIVNTYMQAEDRESDLYEIHCDAIHTLAVLITNSADDSFKPLAGEYMNLGLSILAKTDDPDLRKSVFALFSALTRLVKAEIAPVLPQIVPIMLKSVTSGDGIVVHHEEEKDEINIFDDISDDEDEDIEEDIENSDDSESESSSKCRVTVENSYLEEKEQACISLKEISIHAGPCFLPYIEDSFQEIIKLTHDPQPDVKQVALEALQQFCIFLYKLQIVEVKQTLYETLAMLIPRCSELIRGDEERDVALAALNSYEELLDEIKGDVLVGEGHREAIMNSVIDVFLSKTLCQDTDVEDAQKCDDEAEAEQHENLIQAAGNIIPKFAAAIRPDDFLCYFPNVFKLINKLTVKQQSVSQRSFGYGTLAECMKFLDIYVERFVADIFIFWRVGIKDREPEVRNNAYFGLGEMVLHGKDKVFQIYPDILKILHKTLGKETDPKVMDNICGALAKMILINLDLLPMDQVFPAFLDKLPLREDFEENKAIIHCFSFLYQMGHPIFKQYISYIIKVTIHIFSNKNQVPNEVTGTVLRDFIRTLHRDFQIEFVNTVQSSDPEIVQIIGQFLYCGTKFPKSPYTLKISYLSIGMIN